MRRIIVGVDDSASARAALRWAVGEARGHGAALEVVHAWEGLPALAPGGEAAVPALPPAPWVENAVSGLRERAEEVATHALQAVDTTGLEVYRKVVQGPPAIVLVEVSHRADLLV